MIGITLVAALVAPVLAEDEANRADLKALIGTWVAVAGEAEGKAIPKEELPVQWTFKPQGKSVFEHLKRGDEARYSYTIDPSKKPKAIDLTYEGPADALKGKRQFGVYKIEKGELTLCLTDPGVSEQDRPRDFATNGKGVLLMRLTRREER